MGCLCSNTQNAQQNVPAVSNHRRNQEPGHHQQPSRPGNIILDVNEQYRFYFDILDDQSSGNGLKKTKAYISRVTKQQIEKLRNTFWETRVEGNQDVWAAIRSIISEDEETASLLIQEAELKPVNNSLQHVYDKSGKLYDIPVFCINDPFQYAKEKIEDRGLTNNFKNEQVTLKIRCSYFNGVDLDAECNLKQKVNEFKEEINILISVKMNTQCESLRLFYKGKEMIDSYELGRYQIENNEIVIAHMKTLDKK